MWCHLSTKREVLSLYYTLVATISLREALNLLKLTSFFFVLQEKGTTCLHVACRAGQPAQAELLVAWGAEPTARDHSGNMPADCARYEL